MKHPLKKDQVMKNRRTGIIRFCFFAVLTGFTALFFIRMHPLILHTPDDWRYLNYWRDFAFTVIGRGWNPGRVLPEILMPVGAWIGVYFLMPLGTGFVRATAIGLAVIVTLAILLYMLSFDFLIRRKTGLGLYSELSVTLLFFLMHFWIFRSAQSGNTYLFDGYDPNLYFYYVIPYMLNFSVCFIWYAMGETDGFREITGIKKGLWWLIIYLAVFSNMFVSIILAVFTAIRCLSIVLKNRGKQNLRSIAVSLRYELAVIVLWLYSLAAEATGGNAGHISEENSVHFAAAIKDAVAGSIALCKQINKYFAMFVVLMVIILICIMITKKKSLGTCIGIILWGVMDYSYLILLCGVVGSEYISRAMVSACYLIPVLLIISLSAVSALELREDLITLMPLVVLIIVSLINTTKPVFAESPGTVRMKEKLDNYFVEEFMQADLAGSNEIRIKIPDWYAYELEDYDLYSVYIPSTLYKYGIISGEISCVIE